MKNSNTKLVVGLGNPGEKYKKTRHNTGFMATDIIKTNFQFSIFNFQSIFNAQISNGIYENQKIILVKPQSFMNESGKTVKAIADYYKINIADIIVIHDDLDIALGKYKIVRDRTSAGHKGVQSIIDSLGTKDFTRIRIGIEIPDCKIPVENFVLENFTQEEEKIINEVIEKIIAVVPSLVLETRNHLNIVK